MPWANSARTAARHLRRKRRVSPLQDGSRSTSPRLLDASASRTVGMLSPYVSLDYIVSHAVSRIWTVKRGLTSGGARW
jgi:hypothetical protein